MTDKKTIYSNEIYFLQKEKDQLLARIRIYEQHLNYLEKIAKLYEKDILDFQEMIMKFFRIWSLIDCYEVFGLENASVENNMDKFLDIFNSNYAIRMSKFIKDLSISLNITTM